MASAGRGGAGGGAPCTGQAGASPPIRLPQVGHRINASPPVRRLLSGLDARLSPDGGGHHAFIDRGALKLDGPFCREIRGGSSPQFATFGPKNALRGGQRFVASQSTPRRASAEKGPSIRLFAPTGMLARILLFDQSNDLVTTANPERSGDAKPTGLPESAGPPKRTK